MRYTLKKFADEYPSDYQVYDIQLHGIVRKAHSFRGGWIAHLFYKFDVYVIVDFIHIL